MVSGGRQHAKTLVGTAYLVLNETAWWWLFHVCVISISTSSEMFQMHRVAWVGLVALLEIAVYRGNV